MMEWSERIPAAIEKAEGLAGGAAPFSVFGSSKHPGCFTPGEVALAQALWEVGPCDGQGEGTTTSHCDAGGCSYDPTDDPALRDFTKKVEAL